MDAGEKKFNGVSKNPENDQSKNINNNLGMICAKLRSNLTIQPEGVRYQWDISGILMGYQWA
jgi:hypothetical protein